MTQLIAKLADGHHSRLFAGRQAIIAHAGLTKLFRDFGKMAGVVIHLRRNPQIRQRRLFFTERRISLQGTSRNACQQQEYWKEWGHAVRHRH